MTSRHSGRPGFTLIELLIVIAIIAILASLGTWAAIAAVGAAQRGAIVYEVGQMKMLVEQLAPADKRSYPPDFTDNAYTVKYIQTYYKRFNSSNLLVNYSYMDATNVGGGLDPAEALVFWTVFANNGAQNPFPAPNMMTPNNGPGVQATQQIIANSAEKRFNFDLDRLVDNDGDGWPEYIPPYADQQAPYVYFVGPYYTQTMMGPFVHTYSPPNPNLAGGMAAPYCSTQLSAPMNPAFMEPKMYQIISAGLDGDYGMYMSPPPMTLKYFPDGTGYELGDEDNITSFSEGTLGDSRP